MLTNRWAHPAVYTPAGRGAGDADGSPRPLPAAHGQHDSPRLDGQIAVGGIDCLDEPAVGNVQHHGVGLDVDAPGRLVDEPPRVLRPGQLLLEIVEPEPVVNALIENAPQRPVPFQHEDGAHSLVPGGHRRRQPAAAANDDQIISDGIHVPAPP